MGYDARILTGIGVLTAVTEAGNFARAAEHLGMTPSGVSRAIARLEDRVGVRLFDRTSRAVTLTEEGRRFHAQLRPLLDAVDEIATDVSGASVKVTGRLRVNIDPWFARLVLAPRLERFVTRFPEVTLDLTVSNHREEMMTGTDVAVRFGPPKDSSLVARKLLETRVVTVASPAYLAKRGTPRKPEDVARHECILFRDPHTGRPFPWGFQRRTESVDVEVSGHVTFDDPSSAINACLAGLGIFQSLEMGLAAWLARGELERVLPEWNDERYPLYVYHASRHRPAARVRAFLDFVQLITAEDAPTTNGSAEGPDRDR
jgi:DNA-binding transcriptional LysR family regulator